MMFKFYLISIKSKITEAEIDFSSLLIDLRSRKRKRERQFEKKELHCSFHSGLGWAEAWSILHVKD